MIRRPAVAWSGLQVSVYKITHVLFFAVVVKINFIYLLYMGRHGI